MPIGKQLPTDSSIFWGELTFLPKNPFGPPLANLGDSHQYQNYLNDNHIIYGHIAGTHQYHDAVIRNVYHYNGGSGVIQFFNFPSREDLCVKEDRDGFGYEFNRDLFDWLEAKGMSVRPNKATPMEAVLYILNMSRRLRHRDIHILELQPCKEFSLTEEDVKLMIPGLGKNHHRQADHCRIYW